MSLKDQIRAAAEAARSKTSPITAWNVPCFIRVMSGTERDAWEAQIFHDGKMVKEQFRAKLLVKTLADSEGKRVFDDADLSSLSDMDSVELDRLYAAAAKANGLTANDVDELTKN